MRQTACRAQDLPPKSLKTPRIARSTLARLMHLLCRVYIFTSRVLLLFALIVLSFGVVSCGSEDTAGAGAAPGTGGGGGTHGTGGAGGTPGTGGGAGGGGAGGDCCAPSCETDWGEASLEPVGEAIPPNFAAEPSTDSSELISSADEATCTIVGELFGSCGGDGCTGNDPVDQWSITPSLDGTFRIELSWDVLDTSAVLVADSNADLDLYLLSSDNILLGQSTTEGRNPEAIVVDLTAGQTYTIQAQTFDSDGYVNRYTLTVTKSEQS